MATTSTRRAKESKSLVGSLELELGREYHQVKLLSMEVTEGGGPRLSRGLEYESDLHGKVTRYDLPNEIYLGKLRRRGDGVVMVTIVGHMNFNTGTYSEVKNGR